MRPLAEISVSALTSPPRGLTCPDVEPPVFRPFAHLATPNVALYRRVMGEFVAAKRRFVVHLRTEDLHEALARAEPNGHVPVDALADALGQLVEWGNLRADPGRSPTPPVQVAAATAPQPAALCEGRGHSSGCREFGYAAW